MHKMTYEEMQAMAPAEYTTFQKRIWRRGYESGAASATPPSDNRSPSYDALLSIVQSECGALSRAGIEDCDDPGEAIDVMREKLSAAGVVLENARRHLPTKVETSSLGDMSEEDLAIFDSGFNAALDRAHGLLNMSAGAILKREAMERAQGGQG